MTSRAETTTLVTQTTDCISQLRRFSEDVASEGKNWPAERLHSLLVDRFGRFSIWTGTIGALQDQRSHASLDYRVRNAPRLAA